ncbi:MAG: DUF4296 domain-containing protein [Fluviicola sp.]|nr:DUF4296 domain-containing protein [Fluviicola sp.]
MIRIIPIFFLFLFFSCTTAKIKRLPAPDNLISEKKLVSILKDMTVMECYVLQKMPSLEQNHKVMSETGLAILAKHQIDSEVLDQVNLYLAKEQAGR